MSELRALDRLASAVAVVLEAPLVVASVFDGARQSFVGAHGLIEPLRSRRWTELASPTCRSVAEAGRPVVIQDARRRLPLDAQRDWGGFEVAGYAAVPLMRGDASMGALTALDSQRRAWRARDLIVLRSFADAIAAVMDRGRVRHDFDELEQVALRDDLTGLLNRRGFYVVVENQLALARTQHVGGLLLYFDLDGLKATNDREGHAAGDDVLRCAADVLRACFREADTIARLGGDEFVVFATDAPEHDLAVIRARLVAELGRVNQRDHRSISWSVGVVPVDSDRPEPLDVMLAEADRRMYSAKRELRTSSS